MAPVKKVNIDSFSYGILKDIKKTLPYFNLYIVPYPESQCEILFACLINTTRFESRTLHHFQSKLILYFRGKINSPKIIIKNITKTLSVFMTLYDRNLNFSLTK